MKNFLANVCSVLGAPFTLSIFSAYSGLNSPKPYQFVLSCVAAIITLPLAPFALIGSTLSSECDVEDFSKRTAHLPHLDLSKEYAYIDNDRQDPVETWYAIIDYSDEGFYEYSSEEEARNFLISKGYQEIVATNYPNHLDTFWIKTS